VLVHQVETRLAERVGSAPSNFAAALPAPDSELAQQLVRDPYVFDHLALSKRVAERELEQALVDRLQETSRRPRSGAAAHPVLAGRHLAG